MPKQETFQKPISRVSALSGSSRLWLAASLMGFLVAGCGWFGSGGNDSDDSPPPPPPQAAQNSGGSGGVSTTGSLPAISFLTHIQPILNRDCTSCHPGASINPDLSQYHSELSATARTEIWTQATGRVVNGTMPPSGALPASEMELFSVWQRLGFPYDDVAAQVAAASVNPDSAAALACYGDAYETNGIIPLSRDDIQRSLEDIFYSASLPTRYGYQAPKNGDQQNAEAALEIIPQDAVPGSFIKGPEELSLAHIEAWSSVAELVSTGIMENGDIFLVLEGEAIPGAAEGQLQWRTCLTDAQWWGEDSARQADLETCVKNFYQAVGTKAYRRPLTDSELNRLYSVFLAGRTSGAAMVYDGIRLGLEAMLQSPYFLNRVELGQLNGDAYELGPYELASKLAFTLWGRPPDSELLDRAAEGTLTDPQTLITEVERMLQVEKWVMEEFDWATQSGPLTHFFKARLSDFTAQWLELESVIDPTNHTDTFFGALATHVRNQPAGTFKNDIIEETQKTMESVIVDQSGGFQDLMQTRTTWHAPSSILEGIYYKDGPEASVEPDWDTWADCSVVPAGGRDIRGWCQTPVYGEVPESRAGLVNRLALLVQMSPESVPVHRGAFVREKFLCEDVHLPENIPLSELVAPPPDFTQSKRSRWESRTSPAACEACHVNINPIGFVMEQYDSIGRTELTELLQVDNAMVEAHKNLTVDPRIPDSGYSSISNTLELTQALAASEKAQKCFVEKWLSFSADISLTSQSQCLIDDLHEIDNRSESGGLMQVVRSFVLRESFRNRRSSGENP